MSVCLSAHTSQKPHGQTSTFCSCFLWQWLGPPLTALLPVCEWRHVFTQWALWCVMCVPERRERIQVITAKNYLYIDSNQILFNNIKYQQIHIVGCAPKRKVWYLRLPFFVFSPHAFQTVNAQYQSYLWIQKCYNVHSIFDRGMFVFLQLHLLLSLSLRQGGATTTEF